MSGLLSELGHIPILCLQLFRHIVQTTTLLFFLSELRTQQGSENLLFSQGYIISSVRTDWWSVRVCG